MSAPYTGPTRWFDLAVDILAAVQAGTTSTFSRATVEPGLIPWDGCDCGALYIMVNQMFDSEMFPQQKVDADQSDGCGAIYDAAEYVLQVMECAPSPVGHSRAPKAAVETSAAQLVQRDAYEVRKAVRSFLCNLRDERGVENYIIDTQIVQGPSGGCMGTELRFRVALMRET
jgi:hypothetical protein